MFVCLLLLACLDEIQEALLHYPGVDVVGGGGRVEVDIHTISKFYVKVLRPFILTNH